MLTCPACSREVPEPAVVCPGCGGLLAAPGAGSMATQTVTPSRLALREIVGALPLEGRFVAGTILAKRYRVVTLLGRSGMGEVYKADDLTLGQAVALKFMPDSLAANAAALVRFHAETRIARRVSHPNVCRVYDVGEVDGLQFLTMEFIDGEDLSSLLRRIGRLPGDKAVEIARQICARLAAAHDAGVIHRDLKPANVMIDGRGRARLTDFGVAAIAKEMRGADLVGTPAYMAPEQVRGGEATIGSDIYSLGSSEGLRPALALACLLATIIGLLLAAWRSERDFIAAAVPLELPPEVIPLLFRPSADSLGSVGWLGLAISCALAALLVLALIRFGLTAVAACWFAHRLLILFPTTLNFSAWYVSMSIFTLGAVIALAAYACYTSVGRHRWASLLPTTQ